jgi:hypothetical protein
MPDFMQFVSTLREQMHATLSRSDVLKPVAWLVGLLVTLTLGLTIGGVPHWLLIVSSSLLGASVLLYVGAYLFCLIVDRDSLRSEKYSLQKMAIEHGIYGDNRTGIIEPGVTVPKMIGQAETATKSEAEK